MTLLPEGFTSAVPSPLLDPEVRVLEGPDSDPRSATEATGKMPHHDSQLSENPCNPRPQTVRRTRWGNAARDQRLLVLGSPHQMVAERVGGSAENLGTSV